MSRHVRNRESSNDLNWTPAMSLCADLHFLLTVQLQERVYRYDSAAQEETSCGVCS